MNSISVKTILGQVGLWCVLVMVVVLLTLLFTILGTITCAVLTGMMMAAAARHRRWQTLPVSLVFPGVVTALAAWVKVELVGSQRIVLPSLSFGAFWGMYAVTCVLMSLERRPVAPGRPPETVTSENLPAPPTEAARELQVEELHGQWSCEIARTNGKTERRLIEIAGGELSLSVIGQDGRKRIVGRMKLESSRAHDTLSRSVR